MSIFLHIADLKIAPNTHQTKSVIYEALFKEVENTGTRRSKTKTPPVTIPIIPHNENFSLFMIKFISCIRCIKISHCCPYR